MLISKTRHEREKADAIAKATRLNEEILGGLPQAIFLLDHDLRIRPPISRSAESLFRRRDLLNTAFEKLLENILPAKPLVAAAEFLTLLRSPNAPFGIANMSPLAKTVVASWTTTVALPPAAVVLDAPAWVAAGQDEFAIAMFKRAVEITRKSDGLFSTTQLPYLYPLIDAYERADHTADAEREEQYLVSIAERNFPPQSPQFIASIERQALWQERQYKFVAARHYWARAIEFTRRAGDVKDIRQVNQLRGLARCYRNEFLYGAADAESPVNSNDAFQLGAPSLTQEKNNRLDPEGEHLLQNALVLLQNANGPLGTRLKRDTTLDLGDWNWVAGDSRDAERYYATAWDLMSTEERASTGPDNPLAQPLLLFYSEPRAATKNPKAKPEDIEEKFVEMEFPVNEKGRVGDIKVTKSDASESQQKSVMSAMHRALYRPRMVDRRLASATGVTFRETVYNKR